MRPGRHACADMCGADCDRLALALGLFPDLGLLCSAEPDENICDLFERVR